MEINKSFVVKRKRRGVREAELSYRMPSCREELSLVLVALKTGRSHQIRVQFADAGHPVVGDAKYGHGKRGQTLCLHAWKLTFVHPHSRREMSFEAERPRWLRGRAGIE